MSGLVSGLLKLTAAGLICGGVLSLGGKGPQKEILRFGCACVMVVLLLTLLRQTRLPEDALSGYEEQLQSQVELRQRESREALLAEVQKGLEEELERQAQARALMGRATVVCTVDQDGVVQVEQAEFCYTSGPRGELTALRQSFAAQLGLSPDRIIITEEAPA